MSLLLNLINYSSSLQSQYRLSLPKQDKKDERARSLNYVKINQQNQRAKMSSKSLSKIFPQKPESNLNPKTRILHRIHHILSLKCKKQYYALFVTLETLKKKNLCLNSQGQFQKLQNRKILTKNNEKTAKILSQEEKKNRILKFFTKVEQIQKIHIIKQVQKHIKLDFFNSIKNNFIYKDSLQKLIQKVQSLQLKILKHHTFKKFKKINHFCFKVQILSTLVDSLLKKYTKKKKQLSIQQKNQVFLTIKSVKNKVENKDKESEKVLPQDKQNIICDNKISIDNKIPVETTEIQQASQQIMKIPQKIKIKKQIIETSRQSLPKDDNLIQKNLKSASMKQIESQNQQISLSQIKPLKNLRDLLIDQQKRKFQRNQFNMTKSLSIRTQTDQKSMMIQKKLHNDKASNFCKKLPKNYIRVCYNDTNQESNLFSNNQIIGSNEGFRSNVTNVFKESRVTPYRNKRNSKVIDSNLNSILKPLDFKEQEISSLSISDISQVSMLKTQKSTNTLFNDKSFNFSTIGTEAVNFKNSLVHQRQSLKQGDRNFMKKRPNCLQQQSSISGKSFLRSTLDSKTKTKLQQKLMTDRTFSKDKASQISGRLIVLDNDISQISRNRESYWTRPSSPKVQNTLEKDSEKNHVIFSNNTSFFYENATIYPTKDDSGFKTVENSGRKITQNCTQPFISQKNSKQKSFIKLMSKRQVSFIKESK